MRDRGAGGGRAEHRGDPRLVPSLAAAPPSGKPSPARAQPCPRGKLCLLTKDTVGHRGRVGGASRTLLLLCSRTRDENSVGLDLVREQ